MYIHIYICTEHSRTHFSHRHASRFTDATATAAAFFPFPLIFFCFSLLAFSRTTHPQPLDNK